MASSTARKTKKGENAPDYTGPLDVNGVPYRLAGWIKASKKTGKKFLSLAIEPKKNETGQKKTDHGFDDDFQM